MSDLNQQIKELAAPGVFKTREDRLTFGADELVAWALMVHQDTMRVMRGEQKEYGFLPDDRAEARDYLATYGLSKPGGKKSDLKVHAIPSFNVFLGAKPKELPFANVEILDGD